MAEASNVPTNIVPVIRTKKTAHQMLEGYNRLPTNGCKALKSLDDLLVLVQKGKHLFTLKNQTVHEILNAAEETGDSLCRVLFFDLFGLSHSQYKKVLKEFNEPTSSYGVYLKNQSQYAIFVEVPEREEWYQDRRVQAIGAGSMALSAVLGVVGHHLGHKHGTERAELERIHNNSTEGVVTLELRPDEVVEFDAANAS